MINALHVLDLARQHGFELEAHGDKIRWQAPETVPEDVVYQVLAGLRQHKPVILAALSGPPLDASGIPIGPCPTCGAHEFWRWPAHHPHHDGRWHWYRCNLIPPKAGPCDACTVPRRPVASQRVEAPRDGDSPLNELWNTLSVNVHGPLE